ncbi:MAG: hypothetical protein QM662_02535 [Gordonia sp. (in: high G+C Gram-positive bacteria)]
MTTHLLVVEARRPPMTLNEQRRAHWTQVRAAKQHAETLVWAAAHTARLGHLDHPVTIDITWWAPDQRRRDVDSLAPFTKAALDALVKHGHLDDDDHTHVTTANPHIHIDRARPRIEIEIVEVE